MKEVANQILQAVKNDDTDSFRKILASLYEEQFKSAMAEKIGPQGETLAWCIMVEQKPHFSKPILHLLSMKELAHQILQIVKNNDFEAFKERIQRLDGIQRKVMAEKIGPQGESLIWCIMMEKKPHFLSFLDDEKVYKGDYHVKFPFLGLLKDYCLDVANSVIASVAAWRETGQPITEDTTVTATLTLPIAVATQVEEAVIRLLKADGVDYSDKHR